MNKYSFMLTFLPALIFGLFSFSCGHTNEEMAVKQRLIYKLMADLKSTKALREQDQRKYAEAQAEVGKLQNQINQINQKSLEYQKYAQKLESIEAHFRNFKTKLKQLTKVGIQFVIRNGRMVIQLPGDLLFDSGRDNLKPEGKEILRKVAAAIGNDLELRNRKFQVAGYTDNAKYPPNGRFKDNLGLSLAQARQVLLFLTATDRTKNDNSPDHENKGLEHKNWSAAGYGETDPQAGTVDAQTPEQMAKNRRVELILQPNIDEMLELSKDD